MGYALHMCASRHASHLPVSDCGLRAAWIDGCVRVQMMKDKSWFGGDPDGTKYGKVVQAPMPYASCDGLTLSDGTPVGAYSTQADNAPPTAGA